jgi:Na+/proline symporter/signal transduction histidine kinase/CheY-like chemotaxis protein
MNLHTIDISIVVGYLVLCLIIGLFKFGKIKNIRDYTLGNKPFSTMVLIATTFATAIDARQIIGNLGKSYEMGLVFIIPLFFVPVSWFITAKIFAPNLELFRKHKFMSLSDIMEHWYGKVGRWLTNILSIILTMGVTATSTLAIGYLLHYFTNIPETLGMIIGLAIVTCYSAFGGILSVAFTDVFQFLIFFIALPLACAIGYHKVGGFEEIYYSLPETHLKINAGNILLFLSFILYALVPRSSIPFIQRTLIAKDKKQFITTFTSVGVLMIPMLLIICLISLIIYKSNPNINPNIALYYFIDHYLSSGMKGLMIAGLLAIIMSTQDSFLNTTSALISHDICKKIWPILTDKQELLIARGSCVFIAIASMLIVFLQKNIIEVVWLVNSFWTPLITFPFLAGLIGGRISKKSFITMVLLSLTALIITRLITGTFDTRSLSIGVITSVIVLYFANRRYKKQHPELVTVAPPKEKLLTRLKNNALSNKLQLGSVYIFCIVMLLSYAALAFIFPQLWFMKDTIFYLQSIAATLCLLMLLNELWVDKTKRSKYIISAWHFMLCFCLPFLSSYLMFVYGNKALLIANCVLSVILLRVLSNTVMSIIFAFVGIGLGYVLFSIDNIAPILNYNMFAVYSMSSMTIVMAIFLHNKKYIEKQVIAQLEQTVVERTHDLQESKNELQESKNNLQESKNELQKALSIKREFLRNISHEVRAPITGIVGTADVLADRWHIYSDEQRHEGMKSVNKAGKRLLKFMNNILDLSKFELGKMSISMSEGNLEEVVKEMIQEQTMLCIKDKDITLETHIQPGIDSTIVMDEMRISQVLRNIIDNAIRCTKSGTIKTYLQEDGNYLKVTVTDEGVGIPKDELEAIFGYFVESTRTKTGAGGTGLGLSLCREILDAHKGRIWGENNKNKGASFHFLLPKLGIAEEEKTDKLTKGVVVVIDDDLGCHGMLNLVFRDKGFKIISLYGGVEGLDYLRKHSQEKIDVILLDLMMPDMYGINLLQKIKSNKTLQHIPVIIQSGSDDAKERKKALDLGAVEFLNKPYAKEKISLLVNKYKKN